MKFSKIIGKVGRLVRDSTFWQAILLLVVSFVFIPALGMKFWWVDDGWDIMTARQILNASTSFRFGDLNVIFNEPGGRFRVVYWLYQTFEYLISGVNPTLHFLIHYLVILLSALLIFKIVLRLTKSNLSAFFSSSLYVLAPINTENLFRLGPQEPLLGLFLILSLYFLFKNKVFPSVFFLVFAILTKENGFVLWIPVFGYYIGKRALLGKRDKNLEKYCLWGLVFTIPAVLNMVLRNGGYSGFYNFDISRMVGNFTSYIFSVSEAFSPVLIILLSTYAIRAFVFFQAAKYKKDWPYLLFEAMFVLLFLTFIVIQSPWEFVLNRYLMPASIGLVMFIGMEIAAVKELMLTTRAKLFPWLAIIFVIYLVSFFWINIMHIFLSGELLAHQTTFIQSLYKNLEQEVPGDGIVLLNFRKGDSTRELVVETGIHLKIFYDRSDIRVDYLNLNNLPKSDYIIVGTPQIPEEYSRAQIEKRIRGYKSDESLAQNDKYLVITTPMNLFKQVIKKTYQFIIHKIPLTSEGIYTFYISQDYWYKYYVSK